ncbi:protachykinin-1 [Anarhichas minor]|uniref:protachykinin-1 n=1 Tax=Anarhichas minor TaxID=65739 RepID=UPI003F7386A3
MMKLVILPVLMAFFAVAQVFCEENDPKQDADYWTNSNDIQDGWLANDPFREILLRMTRKPRPHQFIGLMGKRSMGTSRSPRHAVCLFLCGPVFVNTLLSLPSHSKCTDHPQK